MNNDGAVNQNEHFYPVQNGENSEINCYIVMIQAL